jgi:hypothetical protein
VRIANFFAELPDRNGSDISAIKVDACSIRCAVIRSSKRWSRKS